MRISDWSSDVCSSDLHSSEELSQALVEARVYEKLIAAYEAQQVAWEKAQGQIEDAKQKAKDYTEGAEALAEARGLVNAYLAPSLSRVATSLIHQMTNEVLTSVEVDEDMNIMVDGQDIATLSGAVDGKSTRMNSSH